MGLADIPIYYDPFAPEVPTLIDVGRGPIIAVRSELDLRIWAATAEAEQMLAEITLSRKKADTGGT